VALEKTKLVVEIEAKLNGSDKNIGKVTKSVEDLGKGTKKASKQTSAAMQQIEQKMNRLAKQIENSPDLSNALSIDVRKVAASSNQILELAGSMGTTSVEAQQFTKALQANTKAMNTYQEQASGFEKTIRIFDILQDTISNFIQVVQILTDPQTLGRIASLIKAFALLARMRGFKVVSDQLMGLSDTVNTFAKSMKDVNMSFLNKQFLELEGNINKAASALALFDTGVTILKSSILAFFTLQAARQFAVLDKSIVATTTNIKLMGIHAGGATKTLWKLKTKGILGVSQSATSLSSALFMVSGLLAKSEQRSSQFAAAAIGLAAVLAGGFSFAVFGLLKVLADLSIAMGEKLIGAMTVFEAKAMKAETATKLFAFTVEGFARTMGEEAVGSLDAWNQTLEETAQNSVFSSAEISKSIKLLVADASVLGITYEQNQEILKTSADIASAQGQSIVDVTNNIISALNGQGVALRNSGVDLTEAGLSHSKYAKAIDGEISSLEGSELVQARYNVLLEKSAPILGAAAAATDTVAGANARLASVLDNVAVKLGSSGQLTRLFITAQTELAQAFLDMPDAVFDAVGSLQDFLGVLLKVGGTVFKYTFLLGTLISGYTILKHLVASNIFVQGVLTKTFALASAAAGVQTVQVTSLGSAYLAFSGILKGVFASSLTSMVAILKGLTLMMWDLSKAILFNPLFIKGAAIVGAVVLLSMAIGEMVGELQASVGVFKENKKAVSDSEKGMSAFAKGWERAKKIFIDVADFLKNTVKFVLTGTIVLIAKAGKGFLFLGKAIAKVTGGPVKRFERAMKEMDSTVEDLQSQMATYAVQALSAFDEVAKAAEKTAKKVAEIKKNMSELATVARLSNAAISGADIKTGIFGTEFQKSILNANLASVEYSRVLDKIAQGTIKVKDAEKARTAARVKAIVANEQVRKLQLDTVRELKEQGKAAANQALRDSGNLIAAVQKENQARVAAFEKRVAGLMLLKSFTKESLAGINAVRKALQEQNKAALDKATIETRKKALEEEIKLFDASTNAQKTAIDLQIKLNEARMGSDGSLALTLSQMDLKNKLAQLQLDNQIKQLEFADAMTPALREQIKSLKEALDVENERAKNALKPITIKTIFEGAKDLVKDIDFAKIGANFKKVLDIQEIKKGLSSAFESIKNIDMDKVLDFGSGLLDMAKGAGNAFVDVLLNADLSKIGAGILAGFEGFISGVATLFDPAAIKGAADFFSETLSKLPQMLTQAFSSLSTALQSFIADFADTFQNLLSQMPAILQGILDMLPAVIESLFSAVESLVEALPNMLARVISAIPAILESILAKLPDIISSIFKALPIMINSLIRAIPGVIVQILEALPTIVEEFVSGIVGAAGEIMIGLVDALLVKGGLEKIIVALVKAMPKVALAFVKGVINGLKRAFSALFKGIKIPSPDVDVGKLSNSLDKVMKKVGKGAAKASEDLFALIDLDKIKKKKKPLGDLGDQVDIPGQIDAAIENLKSMWQSFIDMLLTAWRWIWDTILNPIVELVKNAFMWVWDNVIAPIAEEIIRAFTWVIDNIIDPLAAVVMEAFSWVVDNILTPMAEIVGAAFKFVEDLFKSLPGIVSSAWKFVVDLFSSMGEFVKKAWGYVVDLFKSIGEFVKKAFMAPINFFKALLKGNVKEAFKVVTDLFESLGETVKVAFKPILDLFDGLEKVFERAVKPFKNIFDVSALGEQFKKVFNALSPSNLLGKLFKVDGKGKGKVEKLVNIDVPFANFAKGGIVPGTGAVSGDSELNDQVLALLSPGERIVPRSAMQDEGVKKVVDAIIKNGKLPKFAFGGVVGSALSKGAKDAGGSVSEGAKELGGAISKGGKSVIEGAKSLDPRQILEKYKELIEKHATGFLETMLSANSLYKGGVVKGYANGGMVDDTLIATQSGEFVLKRAAVESIGAGAANSINNTGKLPQTGGGTVENKVIIEEGAIVIQGADRSPEDIAEEIIDKIKRRSLDGEFILSLDGLRAT